MAGFAIAALLQAVRVLPRAADLDQSRSLANRIMTRDRVVPAAVERQLDAVDDFQNRDCAMVDWTAMVLLSGWSSEYAHAQGLFDQVDRRTRRAIASAEKAVQCVPSNGYAWMAIARMSLLNEGFHDRQRRILDLTWQVMPREAWVMLNRAAMLVTSRNPMDRVQRARALDDLARLVAAEAAQNVAEIARDAGSLVQFELAERVATLPFRIQRQYQAEAIAMGLDTSSLRVPSSSADPAWARRHRACQENPQRCP